MPNPGYIIKIAPKDLQLKLIENFDNFVLENKIINYSFFGILHQKYSDDFMNIINMLDFRYFKHLNDNKDQTISLKRLTIGF